MRVYLRSVVAPAVVAALTFAALSGVRAKVTDRAPTGGVTIVEKTPAADVPAPSHATERVQLWDRLASQAFVLDLRPWQIDAWNRYAAALSALFAPAKSPPADGGPIEASGRFTDEVVARGPAATTLASAAGDLRDQLRPEQIVRASNLIPPPWRFIGRAAPAGTPNSVGTSSPRLSTERDPSRIER